MVTALTLLPPCWKPQHKGFGSHWDAAIQTIHLQHVGDLGWLWSHTSLTVPVETPQNEGMKAIASSCGSAQVPGTWGGLLVLCSFSESRDVQSLGQKKPACRV